MTANTPLHLVPKLRFPEFAQGPGWDHARMADLVETVTPPKKLNTSTYLLDGRFPIIDQSASYICGWTTDDEAVITRPLPVIVFGDHTCVLKFIDQPFAQGADGIKIFTARRCVSTVYLYHQLSHRPVVMEQYKRHFSTLKNKVVFFPDPKSGEQQKIADCLGSLGELIAADARKLEALRQHKQGLMQQLFPQPGETVPRLRFPEFRNASDWKTGRCRDIATVLPGYGFPDRFQGNKKGQFPFYKVSDISRAIEEGKKSISEARNYIESDVLEEIRGKPVPTGTIIFAKIGEAIRSNRRVVTTKPAVIDNNTAGVKAIETKSSDDFLFYLWSNVSLIDHAGGVVPAVSKSALENVPLCYPSDPQEQRRIADCLGLVDDLIAAEGRKLDALRQHKQGLMQQLFPSLDRQ